MKKILGIGFISIVLAGFFILAGTNKEEAEKNFIIGLSLPLSGDLAFIGEEMLKGFELAVDESQKDGGSIGLIVEDNGYDPLRMTSVAHKLIDQDKVDVIGTFSLSESKPVRPIVDEAQTPLLVLWDSDEEIKSAGGHVFSNGFSTEGNAHRMADFAFNNIGARKMAVVYDVDEITKLFAVSFEDEFENLGGEIVTVQPVQIGEKDYRTVLAKVKQSGADSIYFPILPPSNIVFVKQVREMELNVDLFTADSFVEEVVQEIGVEGNGVYFHNFISTNSRLAELYEAKYGSLPAGLNFVESGYHAAQVILEAYKNNPNSINDGLLSVLGEDRTADRLQPIYKAENGQSVLVLE